MNAYSQFQKLVLPLLVFSFVTNIAVLISPLFMMQVIDRVIPSGNTATLLLLGGLALAALVLQAIVEAARNTCLGRVSRWSEHVGTQMALSPGRDNAQSLVDKVAGFAAFLGGASALAAMNIPWIPLICIALYLVHPSFFVLLTLLVAAAWVARVATDLLVSADATTAQHIGQQERNILTHASDFQTKTGMAMVAQRLQRRFLDLQGRRHILLERHQTAQSAGHSFGNFLRSAGQILALALGAFLVTAEALSAGGMIAASIILSKGFTTIEGAVTQLPALRNAFQTYRFLTQQPIGAGPVDHKVSGFSGELRAEGLIVPRGGGAPPRLDKVSFVLKPAECLAIVGSSGSGKSTLLKAIAGVDTAPIGSVFLDQSELRGLTALDLYDIAGYLPQQASLVPGTIAENICSFDPAQDDQKVIEAAKTAGVHGLISALPTAYNTDLTHDLHLLSAGQRQRVALARVIYTKPKYLFLDEPNALLDADGEKALAQTLFRLKKAGTTIVMILHRSGFIGLADKVMRLERGRVVDFGPRAEVMNRLGIGRRRIELPVLETSVEDLRDWIASQFTRSSDEAFSSKAQSVAAELFIIACRSEPSDVPRIASFFFSFVDDTRCEISMVEDLPNDVATKVANVRAKLAAEDRFLSDPTHDEAAMATIEKLSEQVQVSSTDDATHFTVFLSDGSAPSNDTMERLN